MKKMMKTWALIAAAAMGLTACQNDFEEQIEAKDSVVVTFVADSADTRTSVDTSGENPVFTWDESESFFVLEQTEDTFEAVNDTTFELVDGKAHITAEFAANPGKSEYKYVTIYPEDGYVDATDINNATLTLPAEQEMLTSGSYGTSDLMVSEVVTTTAQPTEAQSVRFTRLAAVVKMTVKGLADGETVESVTFEAAGKQLAGEIKVDLEDPHAFEAGEVTSSSVTVTAHSGTTNDIYFTVLPTTLAAGDAYSVVVVTNKNLYIKQGTIPEGKSLEFLSGMVTRLGVNMTDALTGAKWVLVRDASTLKQGDVVTIVAKNYNYVIGKPSSNVYPLASQTEVIKAGNYLYHNPADDSADHMLQSYTLMQRDENLNAFDFYNGVDFEGDTSVGFAWANGSNNTPKLQAFCDKNTLFDVSITDGVATITASYISGSYKYWRYYHNKTYATSRKFDLTSSEITDDANKILLYKLEGVVGTIPTVAANVTVPDSDEPVVIAEEGAAETTAIDAVVFNYIGPWTISVSDNAEWLNVAYDATKNCLTYTAEANTGVKRDAVATITASLEGQESLSWSFNVVQKGVPEEISIAEFMTKGKDENATYKITGQVTEISTSSSGTYKLTDGTNVATVTYLYTDGGEKVCDDKSIGVAVGDVMTVTTVVTSTTKGKGGSSTYRSIYKGHYTITATASGAVGYEGGDATINIKVEKNGNIVAPTAITDKSNVATDNNPVSTYSFTDNGNGTATAVIGFGENTTSGSRKVDLTFSSGSPLVVSTTITIVQEVNPALKTGWWLVTDVNDLEAGDKIIIAATGLDYAISTATNNNNRKSTAITKNGGALEDVSSSVQQYALEIDANGLYSFKGTLGSDANKYIYAPNTKNYMKVTTTLNDSGKWTIDIAGDGAATIVSQGAATYNCMQYNNKATSSPAFYCTDGSMGAVCLYKYFE